MGNKEECGGQMEKKLIFLDIDGTILPLDGEVHRTVKEGLQEARRRGHQIFICTGRSPHMLPESLKDVELDGIVASAGSDIWIRGENVLRESLDRRLLEDTLEFLEQMEVIYILEGFERVYVSKSGENILSESVPVPGDNPEIVRWKTLFNSRKNVGDIETWRKEQAPIPKISFITWSREEAKRVYGAFKEMFHVVFFPPRSDCFFNGELISRTANKGTAVRWTAEYLKAGIQNTIAFGDSMNDYQMIEEAACGVVMANGDPQLKAIADRVCESVEEDGVVKELKRMELI